MLGLKGFPYLSEKQTLHLFFMTAKTFQHHQTPFVKNYIFAYTDNLFPGGGMWGFGGGGLLLPWQHKVNALEPWFDSRRFFAPKTSQSTWKRGFFSPSCLKSSWTIREAYTVATPATLAHSREKRLQSHSHLRAIPLLWTWLECGRKPQTLEDKK